MAFRDDLKRALGYPLIDVELEDKGTAADDFGFIMNRTLRVIREYLPALFIVRKPVPSSPNGSGEGYLDISADGFTIITRCYVVKRKAGSNDVVLPWSIARIWEQIWVGQSDFMGTELLLFQNEVNLLNRVTNKTFGWQWYPRENKVYVTSVPSFAIGIGVEGYKPVDTLDQLNVNSLQYELALQLAKAYAKERIGQFMSKYKVQGVDMPGERYLDESRTEEEAVMRKIEELAIYPGGITD